MGTSDVGHQAGDKEGPVVLVSVDKNSNTHGISIHCKKPMQSLDFIYFICGMLITTLKIKISLVRAQRQRANQEW